MAFQKRRQFLDLTNEILLKEIDQKQKVLVEQPEYRFALLKGMDSSLKYLSDLASWINQNPSLRADIDCELDGRNNHGGILQLSRECARRVSNAWSYLRGAVEYSKKPTERILTPGIILQLAKNLDEVNDSYRKHNEKAESFHPDYEPPHSSQVLPMMEDLCQTLRDTGAHPIDKAVYAHMVIAAIQPFRSAHKRLGRLIQDSILFDHLLPAATIFPGERATYYDFLRNAVIGYSRNDSELKAPFFNYVAGKINVKLDTCVTHLFGEHTDNFSALDNFKHLGNSRRNGKR